jgi:hypothetical protein
LNNKTNKGITVSCSINYATNINSGTINNAEMCTLIIGDNETFTNTGTITNSGTITNNKTFTPFYISNADFINSFS